MNRFLSRVLLFLFTFFLFDKFFIPILYYNPTTQIDRRLEFIFANEMNKDIIILGSSRGARNIIASQLEQQTGSTAYNLSYPGSDVEYHEFILRSLLKYNKPPKAILLAVDDSLELIPSELITFRYESLYPFMKYKAAREEMALRGEKNKLLMELLVLYRLNKSNFSFKKQEVNTFDTLMHCGSMPVSIRSEKPFEFFYDSTSYNHKNELPAKIAAFLKINEMCANYNIPLVLVFSPNYRSHNNIFEKRLRDLSRKETKIYIYKRENPVYRDKSYYFDSNHLVRKGAEIFTAEIATFLKENIIE
jgi:hypothetical protein